MARTRKPRVNQAFCYRLTQEAKDTLDAICAATGWTISDTVSTALVNLGRSKAMDDTIAALKVLRQSLNTTTRRAP